MSMALLSFTAKSRVLLLSGGLIAAADVSRAGNPPETFPLVSSCFDDAERLGEVTASDDVRVRYASVAGGIGSCYAVQVRKDGKTSSGFLLDASLPAIQRFEADVRTHVPLAPVPEPPLRAALVAAATPRSDLALPERPEPTSLSGLRAADIKGNTVDLNALPARHLVVYFWSASDRKSVKAAEAMEHVHDQYASPQKLEFVGIATAKSLDQFQQVMSGSEATYPQILDRGRLADRYHINPARPFVILDRARNVVATVATPRDLAAELQKLESGR
jgi:hypothetical protein